MQFIVAALFKTTYKNKKKNPLPLEFSLIDLLSSMIIRVPS